MGSFSILTNTACLNAQSQLRSAYVSAHRTLDRLASGKRLNTGADDPAGLQIADSLRASVYALRQAERNANDGIMAAQIVDSALSEIHSLLTRGVTLASESANGTVDSLGRASLQAEWSQIQQEVTRISGSTNFNGLRLLEYPSATSSEPGTFSIFVGDTSGSSTIDLSLPSIRISASSGLAVLPAYSGEQPEPASVFASQAFDVLTKDETLTIDSDGAVALVQLRAGDSRAAALDRINAALSAANIEASANADYERMQICGTSRGDAHTVSVSSDRSTGTGFSSIRPNSGSGNTAQPASLQCGRAFETLTHDETLQITINAATVSLTLRAGDDLASALVQLNSAFSGAGIAATATSNNGAIVLQTLAAGASQQISVVSDNAGLTGGTGFGSDTGAGSPPRTAAALAPVSFQILDQNEILTIDVNGHSGTASLSEGDNLSTVISKINSALSGAGLAATARESGGSLVLETTAAGADQQISVMSDRSGTGFSVNTAQGKGIDLSTTDIGARRGSVSALAQISRALNSISAMRAEIGGQMNRLEAARSVLAGQSALQQEAESRIRDADMAAEISDLVHCQILMQVGIAALSQSNASAQNIVKLLNST